MRKIGELPSGLDSAVFADYLRGEGIHSSLDDSESGVAVWIHDEDRLDFAREQLQAFVANPREERFIAGARKGREVIREKFAELKSARKRVIRVQETWTIPTVDRCPITFGLIAISVLTFSFTHLGQDQAILNKLLMSEDGTLRQITQGEVWRLVSPIVLHFSVMHILFNMLWLRDFGFQLESRLGTPWFLGLVLPIAVISNLAQFHYSPTEFGGMSGVNYGLFGYLWLRGTLEPESGLFISPSSVTMLGLWFLICFTGVVGPVANTAHAVGLATGCSMAFVGHLWRKR